MMSLFVWRKLLMGRELDDYQSDIRFGEWLSSQRTKIGITLEAAAREAAIAVERLKALEKGYCERGITRAESVRLCNVYRVELSELLSQASKN